MADSELYDPERRCNWSIGTLIVTWLPFFACAYADEPIPTWTLVLQWVGLFACVGISCGPFIFKRKSGQAQ